MEVVLGIPKLVKVDNFVCGPCQLGKQTRTHHHATLTTATARPIKQLHIDFMGLARIESLGDKRHFTIVVDDFTKFTWAILLISKSKAPQKIEILCKRLLNKKGVTINFKVTMEGSSKNLNQRIFALKLGQLKNFQLLLLLNKMEQLRGRIKSFSRKLEI